ncbi:MAG: PUR family DNA/RNA-binding protein [Bacteroidales bacterium]|nr:PUR family DNA/RNA-binding protein [Bacteroidales bacterium]
MEKPTFSKRISAGTRVYYIDVHIDRKGQPYVAISEIPTDKSPNKKQRQRIFLHRENIEKFARAFAEVATHIKNDSKG